LIARAFVRAINASGPLVSSRESYAERRTELQSAIDDQMANGLYQMTVVTTTETDPITKEVKTINKSQIARDAKNLPIRAEVSPLSQFGVKTFGLTIGKMIYDERVTKQIQQQQDIIMQVQTAIANARKAEQDALTAAKQGEAAAATATWKQKTIAAQATTEAQQQYDVAAITAKQKLDVAALDAKAAEQEKNAKILRGQGDAEARKLILAADNALGQRLDAYVKVQSAWANAAANSKTALVPSVVMGGGQGSAIGGTQDLLQLLGVKAARDLALDTNMAAK
jgi:hypothetical protein